MIYIRIHRYLHVRTIAVPIRNRKKAPQSWNSILDKQGGPTSHCLTAVSIRAIRRLYSVYQNSMSNLYFASSTVFFVPIKQYDILF